MFSLQMMNFSTFIVLGAWARAFKKERMVESPFYTLDGDTVDVPMMSAKASYEISQFTDLKANVIKIPFKM